MPKSIAISKRIKAILRHPGMLKRALYVSPLTALIVGIVSEIFSEKHWVAVGSKSDALLVGWAAGVTAAVIAVYKPLLKSILSDDGQITRIGISQQDETANEVWSFTSGRLIALCAAATVFIGLKVVSDDKLMSILDTSPHAIIHRNAASVCKVAAEIPSQRVSDPDAVLKVLSEADANLNRISDYSMLSYTDRAVLFGSLQMSALSRRMIRGELDPKADDSKRYLTQAATACALLRDY